MTSHQPVGVQQQPVALREAHFLHHRLGPREQADGVTLGPQQAGRTVGAHEQRVGVTGPDQAQEAPVGVEDAVGEGEEGIAVLLQVEPAVELPRDLRGVAHLPARLLALGRDENPAAFDVRRQHPVQQEGKEGGRHALPDHVHGPETRPTVVESRTPHHVPARKLGSVEEPVDPAARKPGVARGEVPLREARELLDLAQHEVLHALALARLPEHVQQSEERPLGAAQRRSAHLDRRLRSARTHHPAVAAQGAAALGERLGNGEDDPAAGGAVEHGHDVGDARAAELLLPPAEQRLGGGVHEGHEPLGIRDQHRVAHARGDRRRPPPRLERPPDALVPVERHLDGRVQAPLVERLEHVAEGVGQLGLLESLGVGEGGEVHHGHVEPGPHALRGLDAVHPALELDVHQHEIRLDLPEPLERVRPRRRHGRHVVPEPFEGLADLRCNEPFVLDHQDPSLLHLQLLPVHHIPGPREMHPVPW